MTSTALAAAPLAHRCAVAAMTIRLGYAFAGASEDDRALLARYAALLEEASDAVSRATRPAVWFRWWWRFWRAVR